MKPSQARGIDPEQPASASPVGELRILGMRKRTALLVGAALCVALGGVILWFPLAFGFILLAVTLLLIAPFFARIKEVTEWHGTHADPRAQDALDRHSKWRR